MKAKRVMLPTWTRWMSRRRWLQDEGMTVCAVLDVELDPSFRMKYPSDM